MRRDALHGDLWLDDPAAHAFAHKGDGLLHVTAEGPQPRDPILVILYRLETERIAQLIFRLNTAALIQWNKIPAKTKSFDVFLGVETEHVVVELVRCRQGVAPDRHEAFKDFLAVRVLARDRAKA
ncbi:MAG: hypothetical protein L3K03_05305 [Thermoplasmata archaeon]|nr:hypothetical protein [Thermoplasmata archaeon]